MAVFFSILFISVAYITPTVAFGPLAEYRVEVLLALLAFGTSLPALSRSRLIEAPQTYAFIGFSLAVPLSILFGAGGWLTGAADVLYGFFPLIFCFLLTAANFRTKRHFQWLIAAMILCSGYYIYNGLYDLQHHINPSEFLYGGEDLRRIRGLGFVHDPNDLAQVLVSLIPMVFLWRARSWFVTVMLCLPPVALLVTGMYFTHSRGGALALMATLVVALRRKLGTVPAAVLAGSLFAASLAIGWSGGRDVSMEAGGDRLDAWSTGLDFIKQHPLTGVGAGRFADFNSITAHNSIVVCAAEIGLPGFVCWVFMVFAALRGAIAVGSWTPHSEEKTQEKEAAAATSARVVNPYLRGPAIPPQHAAFATAYAPTSALAALGTVNAASPRVGGRGPALLQGEQSAAADEAWQKQIRGMARILVCSLTGFLVAGWFISRAFSTWLFFYCGLSFALVRMAEDAGMGPKRDSFAFMLRWSVLLSIALLLVVYALLRFRALTGG